MTTKPYLPRRIPKEVLKSAKRLSKADLAEPEESGPDEEIFFTANRQGICLVCLGLSESPQRLAWIPQTRIARHMVCKPAGLYEELYGLWLHDQHQTALAYEYRAIREVVGLLGYPRHHRLLDRIIRILEGYQDRGGPQPQPEYPALRLLK